jgi:hypothetical protein
VQFSATTAIDFTWTAAFPVTGINATRCHDDRPVFLIGINRRDGFKAMDFAFPQLGEN